MSVCRDYQEVKIQESMQTLGMGSIPRSIVVVLEDDLVDTVKAGGKSEYICRLQAFLIRKLRTWNCISVIRHRHCSPS
jgi:DNA replicative helicase MCM subunit Mcm2 (Cdc46/Mcm family)